MHWLINDIFLINVDISEEFPIFNVPTLKQIYVICVYIYIYIYIYIYVYIYIYIYHK